MLKPARFSNVATYATAFAGSLVSMVFGMFLGAQHGDRIITRDPERLKSIEKFYWKFTSRSPQEGGRHMGTRRAEYT